ncbi:hypothetical protein FQN55_007718 [Onygenales sp. PD_40]|nr:hypothetical protein FQN55_007718 [Onygenales sp. PD_40]
MATPSGPRLQDKVAIITGSSSGIGRSIALAYAAQGAYVACSDINPAPNGDEKATHDAINEAYPAPAGGKGPQRAVFVKVDVTVSAEVEELVKECVKVFGRLDVMVNNAGISPAGLQKPGQRIHDIDEVSWDKVMGINGKGVWLGIYDPKRSISHLEFAAGQMLAQDPHPSGDRGWIINMTSVLGTVGSPFASTYAASKHAVIGVTKSVALEYAKDRIHVNALAPGYTETPLLARLADAKSDDPYRKGAYNALLAMHPFDSRLGQPDDISGAAVFLASEEAKWMTGSTLQVDGGYVAH